MAATQDPDRAPVDVLVPHPVHTLYPMVHYFHPFGSTQPLHLLSHCPRPAHAEAGGTSTSAAHATSLLLLGCGDLRDLFYTLLCEERWVLSSCSSLPCPICTSLSCRPTYHTIHQLTGCWV